jgi:hypothetical protein
MAGHIHKQFLGRDEKKHTTVSYAGNTEFWRIGEDVTKSVTLWKDGIPEIVPLKTRPVIDFMFEDDPQLLIDSVTASAELPIVILRYRAGMSKKANELTNLLRSKTLIIRKVPVREETVGTTPSAVEQAKKGRPDMGKLLEHHLQPGTAAYQLAHSLINTAEGVDSVLSGYRGVFLGKRG